MSDAEYKLHFIAHEVILARARGDQKVGGRRLNASHTLKGQDNPAVLSKGRSLARSDVETAI